MFSDDTLPGLMSSRDSALLPSNDTSLRDCDTLGDDLSFRDDDRFLDGLLLRNDYIVIDHLLLMDDDGLLDGFLLIPSHWNGDLALNNFRGRDGNLLPNRLRRRNSDSPVNRLRSRHSDLTGSRGHARLSVLVSMVTADVVDIFVVVDTRSSLVTSVSVLSGFVGFFVVLNEGDPLRIISVEHWTGGGIDLRETGGSDGLLIRRNFFKSRRHLVCFVCLC